MRCHPSPTYVFADLVGYTALTYQRGDEAAADVAREFCRVMCALVRGHGATQVKSMGDATNFAAGDKVTVSLDPPRELTLRGVDPPLAAWPLV